MRQGVDRNTGAILVDWAHCQQSIGVICSTSVGSLLMARDFGAKDALVDRPMNSPVILKAVGVFAEALRRDEPGFRLTKLSPTNAAPNGVIAFDIAGDFYPNALDGDFSVVERGVSATILSTGGSAP